MTRTIKLLSGAIGAVLFAGSAAALPLSTASLAYNGTINFNSASGLSVVGDLDAQYRTPTGGPRPYTFSSSLGFGAVTVTPSLTITTPSACVVPSPFGCLFALPSITETLTPTIPLTGPITAYDYSYTSSALPLGGIFNFDFGTPLLGDVLTLGNVVQTQFETGATTVNESGSLGPFTGSYDYAGVLQPGGNTILGTYVLDITGPGLLAELEGFALGIINDNTDLLFDLVFDQVAESVCAPWAGVPLFGEGCINFIAGLSTFDVGITVNSIGNLSADFAKLKSIVPVPAPATLPLVALGLALMGLLNVRRRKAITA